MPPLGVVPVLGGQLVNIRRSSPAEPCVSGSEPSTVRASSKSLVARMFVPNGVASAEPDPLRNGPVLLLGLGQLLLDLEGLVALLVDRKY